MQIRSTLVSRAAVVAAGVAISCASLTALAQWTSDPNNPVIVQGDTGDQGVPLVGAAPDGRTWVFYVDNFAAGGGGYKHAIQLLNADGTHAFDEAVVVSPNRTNSATFVVDLDVSPDGSAVVAYDNNGVWVQKVDVDGTRLWDAAPDGLLIPNSTGGLGPQIVGTADGGAVVCWSSPSVTLNFQHVNADGSFGAAWQLTETGRAQSPSDMVRSGDDFIMLWVRAEGTGFTARRGLKIQRWTTAGTQVWNGGVPLDVYTSNATPNRSIQSGYFPRLIADGTGGAIAAWYDNGASRNAWLQHVLPMGVLRFAQDGLAVSTATNATEYRLSASVAYSLADDVYTVAYSRSNPAQSQFDVTVQRIDGLSQRLWNSGQGVQVSPTGNPNSFININAVGDDAIVTWLQYFGASAPMAVHSTRLDEAGTQVWATNPLVVAAEYGSKSRLQTSLSSTGEFIVAAWGDGTSGNSDVMANRINFDGTIGEGGSACPPCAADYDNNGGVDGGDLAAFFLDFEAGSECADVDGNGGVDGGDLGFFFQVFEAGGC